MNDQVKLQVLLEFETTGADAEVKALREVQRGVDEAARAGIIGEKSQLQLSKAIHKTGQAAGDASGNLKRSEDSIISLRYANYDLASSLLGTAAAITAVGAASLTAFASQERAFADVERTLQIGTLPGQVQEIEDSLKSLSTQIPLTFNELSEIATIGNQMGIAADDLTSFTNTVARFSAITGISIESTTKAFGGFMAQTGMAPALLENLGSAIAKVGIDSNATEEQILSLMREITAGATGAGFAAEQIVALSGTLASLQIAPERARGSLTTYFETLNKAVARGGDDLQNFAQIVGVTGEELERMVRAGEGNQVLRGFLEGLRDLDNIDTTRALDELGLAQLRVTDTFRRLSGSLQLYDRDQQNANQSFQEATELQRQYAFIVDTLASKFQILLNALMNFGAQVGSELAPAFSRLIDIATQGIIAMTEFAQSPVGEALVRTASLISGALAAWLALRGAIALATASTLAFQFIVRGLGGAGIISGLKGLATAMLGVGNAGKHGASGVLALRGALLALGRAVVVGAVLSYIAQWIFAPGEAAQWTGEMLIWFADTAISAISSVTQALGPLAQLAGVLTGQQLFGGLKDLGNWFLDVAKNAPSAAGGLDDFDLSANSLAGDMENLLEQFDTAPVDDFGESLGGLGDAADAAGRQIRTLVDYASDLRQIWDRAFEIRFSGSQTADAITSTFISIREAADAAAKKIRDLKNDIRSLSSDISIQEYFLSIAIEYGDTKRAEAIEAELAKKRAELADKTAELQKEQDAASKSLVGNSKGAIENRKQIQSLVQQYQAHIGALAASGMSQDQLAQATARLREDFIRQATQLGYNRAELELYAKAFDDVATAIRLVPRNITVKANTNPAIQAFNEMKASMDRASKSLNSLRNNVSRGVGSMPSVNTYGARQQAMQARLNAAIALLDQYRRAKDWGNMRSQDNFVENLRRQLANGNFYTGGYTGPGGKYEPAGIVHRGEYVIPKQDVNQATGLPYADALGRLMGGLPSRSSAPAASSSGSGGVTTVALTAGTIQAIANATGKVLVLDGQVIADSSASVYRDETTVGAY